MYWKRHIESCYLNAQLHIEHGTLPIFDTPADIEDILEVEQALNVLLPVSLKELLTQTNGVFEQMKINGEIIRSGILIFSLANLRQLNENFRRSELETKQILNSFIFFGTAGVDGIHLPLNPLLKIQIPMTKSMSGIHMKVIL